MSTLNALAFDFDFHLSRLGSLLLGQGDGENAVLEFRSYLFRVDGGRHGETASERAVAALNPMIALYRVILLEFALALEGEGLVFHADFDVLELDVGEIGFENQLVLGFIDV